MVHQREKLPLTTDSIKGLNVPNVFLLMRDLLVHLVPSVKVLTHT